MTLCFSYKPSVSQRERDLAGFPFVAGFHDQRGHQAQAGRFVQEDAHHAGALANLLVQPFQHVHGTQIGAMHRQPTNYGHAL